MATKNFTGTPERADHTGTAPVPPAAEAALSCLERASAGRSTADVLAHEAGSYVRVTPEVQRAVVRFRICSKTLAELENKRIDSVLLFNELKNAQAGIAEARAILTAAGQLHLVVAS